MDEDLIGRIDAEERALALTRFGNDDAWWLGSFIRSQAVERGLPIAIEIRRGPSLLFACLMDGAAPNNFDWIRRKVVLVERFERSSYVIGQYFRKEAGMFERSGLDLRTAVAEGGAVPIRVQGTGMVGVATVSGLPQEEDHGLVVDGLRRLAERQRGSAVHPSVQETETGERL